MWLAPYFPQFLHNGFRPTGSVARLCVEPCGTGKEYCRTGVGRGREKPGGRIGQTIAADFEAWRTRRLSGHEVLYLFVDGMHLKLSPDRAKKQPVLMAYAILWDGKSTSTSATGRATRPAWASCET